MEVHCEWIVFSTNTKLKEEGRPYDGKMKLETSEDTGDSGRWECSGVMEKHRDLGGSKGRSGRSFNRANDTGSERAFRKGG